MSVARVVRRLNRFVYRTVRLTEMDHHVPIALEAPNARTTSSGGRREPKMSLSKEPVIWYVTSYPMTTVLRPADNEHLASTGDAGKAPTGSPGDVRQLERMDDRARREGLCRQGQVVK